MFKASPTKRSEGWFKVRAKLILTLNFEPVTRNFLGPQRYSLSENIKNLVMNIPEIA
jgi:hypothetical protein